MPAYPNCALTMRAVTPLSSCFLAPPMNILAHWPHPSFAASIRLTALGQVPYSQETLLMLYLSLTSFKLSVALSSENRQRN